MNTELTDENIATRKGATAIEVSLSFSSLPSTKICTTNFLDELATSIVVSVGKTDKNLFRLYCSPKDLQVKVQILNTYIPVKNLRSNTDVALELQRQLSYADSPFRSNVTNIDYWFRPPPIIVTNCADTSIQFEPSCSSSSSSSSSSASSSSLSSSSSSASSVLDVDGGGGGGGSWLGLQAHSSTTILIFVAVSVLACLLLGVFALCVRRLWKDKRQVEDKTKWMVAVQKEQAQELAGLKGPSTEERERSKNSTERQLLLTTIAIPILPPSTHATPSPSPRSVPPLLQDDFDSNIYQEYNTNNNDEDADNHNNTNTTIDNNNNNNDDINDEYMETPSKSENAYVSEEPQDAFVLNGDISDDVFLSTQEREDDIISHGDVDTDKSVSQTHA